MDDEIAAKDWAILRGLAARFLPWEDPDAVLAGDLRVLAIRVMNDSLAQDDVLTLRRIFGDDSLRELLATSPSFLFTPLAWGHWHHRLEVKCPPQSRRMHGFTRGMVRAWGLDSYFPSQNRPI